MSVLRRCVTGVIAGSLATVPMTGAFLVARRLGAIDELPPRIAVRSVAPELPVGRQKVLAALAHLAIGASAGAGFGLVPRRLARHAWTGAAFGIGVWLIGYEVVMPRLTELPLAHHDRRDRAVTIFAAHLVFGSVLGALVGAAQRRSR